MTEQATGDQAPRDLPGGGFVETAGAGARALAASAGALVPPYVIAALALLGLQFAANLGYGRIAPNNPAVVPLVLILGLLPTLAGSVLAATTAVVVAARLAGAPAALARGLTETRARPRAVGAAALLAAMLALLVVVLPPSLIPGAVQFLAIFVTVAAVLVGPPLVVQALMLERLAFKEALARARLLGAGHFGRIFAYLFVLAFMVQLLASVATQATFAGGRALGLPETASGWLAIGVNQVMVWLMHAYLAVVALVCYLDLRVRKEGLDRATLRAELEANGLTGPRRG